MECPFGRVVRPIEQGSLGFRLLTQLEDPLPSLLPSILMEVKKEHVVLEKIRVWPSGDRSE
jgi:hypothetical protein